MTPPTILSRAAAALEPRAPGVVNRVRRLADQAYIVRDDVRHRNYPFPGYPFSARYIRNTRKFVSATLADAELVRRVSEGHLPAGYGVGYDERVIEYPWLRAQAPYGRLLDAGSVLNHGHVLPVFRSLADELTIVTLAPEPKSFPEQDVSYVYADLRGLPFRDDWFDTIVCVSTLEHVGMDNTRYGSDVSEASSPRDEADRAVAELRRALRPRGRLLITVPYGAREDHGWLLQFDREDVERLVDRSQAQDSEVAVFAYAPSGWTRSDLDAAAGARFGNGLVPGEDLVARDRAAAARAVACIRLSW